MMNQEIRRLNTTEVVLPQEVHQDPTALLPALMPSSPLDWPVERFTQALDRREVNRRAPEGGRIQPPSRHRLRSDPCGRQGQVPARRVMAALMSASIRDTGASRPSGSPVPRKSAACSGRVSRFPNLAEYERTALGAVDVKVIILKCELHTGNGFVAAEGTGARRIDQDRGDINKSLKMAVKSAHIDATLRVAGLSELFSAGHRGHVPGQGRQGCHVPAGDYPSKTILHRQRSPNRPRHLPLRHRECQQPTGRNGGTIKKKPGKQRPEPNHQRAEPRIQPDHLQAALVHHEPDPECANDQGRAESALCQGLRLRGRSHYPPRRIQPHRLAPQPLNQPVNLTRGKMP